MKTIILVECNKKIFESMVDLVNNKEIYIVNTEKCDETHEFHYLMDSIREFDNSGNEIMLVRFSGSEDIVNELGDERSEMILALSSKENSQYYSPDIFNVFSDLIEAFEKGDKINVEKKKKQTKHFDTIRQY